MNIYIKLLYFLVDLVLPIAVGCLLKRYTKLHKKILDKSTMFVMLVLFPISNLLSIWAIKLNLQLLWLPIMGVVMLIIPGALSLITVKSRYKCSLDQGGYILSAMLSNRGVVGGLSIYIIFGEVGYAYGRLVILFAPFVIFMFCYPMAQFFYNKHKKTENQRLNIKSIIIDKKQLPVLGLIAGFILNYMGISRPAPLGTAFDVLVHVIAWLSIIPIGYALDFNKMKEYWKDVFDFAWIKFIATPILVYLISSLIVKDNLALWVLVITSACPTAINAVIASRMNKLNSHITITAFMTTTTAYMVIVFPIMLLITELVR